MNKQSYCTYYPSPIGILKIEFNNQALISLYFDNQLREVKNNCKQNFYEDPKLLKIYNLIFDQLNEYFMGIRTQFDIPFELMGSQFDLKVWRQLRDISYGETYSYSKLAAKIGDNNAAQAVGQANSRNPIAIIIPCHRVIAADGSVGAYSGGSWRKKWLLNHENNKSKNIERKMSFV